MTRRLVKETELNTAIIFSETYWLDRKRHRYSNEGPAIIYRDTAGTEASMTLGGVADGGSGFARRHGRARQPGCEARFPVAICMSCPGF
jgi:hypothetical protein